MSPGITTGSPKTVDAHRGNVRVGSAPLGSIRSRLANMTKCAPLPVSEGKGGVIQTLWYRLLMLYRAERIDHLT